MVVKNRSFYGKEFFLMELIVSVWRLHVAKAHHFPADFGSSVAGVVVRNNTCKFCNTFNIL